MAEKNTISILVADDCTLLREAFCYFFATESDFTLVSAVRNGEEAVSLAAKFNPDIVLLDLEMLSTQPHVTVGRLLRHSPGSKVIILSMVDNPRLVRELFHVGISAYLHKSVSRHDLVSAIRSVRRGDVYVTVAVSHETSVLPGESRDGILSIREKEILALVAQALSNRQIGNQLRITEGTVKRHMRNIFDKLQAVSRIDAVNKAVAASLIDHQLGTA